MELGHRLTRAFFERPCQQVALELVGALVVRILPDGRRLVGRLVEVEAYLGDGSDSSSHSHRGPTPRNASMFGPAGRIYTYRSYGVHTCVNVVCEARGSGAAVLLRALEPLEGVEAMRRGRGLPAGGRAREIARGPARLGQALGITMADDGASALRGGLTFWAPTRDDRVSPGDVLCGPRVGITKAADLPYRFRLADSPWVSPWRPGKSRRRSR